MPVHGDLRKLRLRGYRLWGRLVPDVSSLGGESRDQGLVQLHMPEREHRHGQRHARLHEAVQRSTWPLLHVSTFSNDLDGQRHRGFRI